MIPPHLDFRLLKRVVSIEHLLRSHGVLSQMRCHGQRLIGPCPVHRGDNPNAFSVDLERQLWYCFTGCQRGGDVVDLVRLMSGGDYRQTAEELARLARIAPPLETPLPSPRLFQPPRPFQPFVRRLSLDPNAPFLRDKGIQPNTARAFEAGAWHRPGFLAHCVGVRLHDVAGKPLGYAGRRLDADAVSRCGKWKFPTGLPKHSLLFNYHRVASVAFHGLVVVECPWGVMRLAQLGVPAVALLGTVLSASQRHLLHKSKLLLLLMDGDPAGRRAARAIRESMQPRVAVVIEDLPEHADPDDLSDVQLWALLSSLSGCPGSVPTLEYRDGDALK